jgi:hypothetical protein
MARGDGMAEYEIASVVWHERTDQIYVTYEEEEPDHMVSTQQAAAGLARDAGLSPVSAPHGILRWVRTPVVNPVAKDEARIIEHSTHPRAAPDERTSQSLWLTRPTTAET